jgi:hypothetical protein
VRTVRALAAAAVAASCALVVSPRTANPGVAACPSREASWAYAGSVRTATQSRADLWGNRLLAARGGPTYAGARRFLSPLLFATQRKQRPLTPSGVYYLPLAYPTTVGATTAYALHLADGSEIITRRVGGPHLTFYVGATGRERYGSCLGRLRSAKLADGYLPIVETSYRDAGGVRYREESFAAHLPNAPSIVSFVRLTIDARASARGAVVRLVTSTRGHLRVDQPTPVHVEAGGQAVVYADWLHRLPAGGPIPVDQRTYDQAHRRVTDYWNRRLALGAQFTVPEDHVQDAERALLIEQMVQGWHYSIGNPYEELSFAEGLDTAQVMAEYGYPYAAKQILDFALGRIGIRYTSWHAGALLLANAVYFQLTHDRAYESRVAGRLNRVVAMLGAHQIRRGPNAGRLEPEPLCSDVPDIVDGLPAQVVAWQGLLAVDRMWAGTGHPGLAARARSIALRLGGALRRAVRVSEVRLPGGALFVPSALGNHSAPYDRLTATRDGSYWNLVMPYVFASGFFQAGGRDARGLLRYMLAHGSRMLGVTRADAHIVYGYWVRGDGLGEAYGLNVSRFLADNDVPDQLTLSLYGMLAIAMTPDTFVSGEAVSVLPLGSRYFRTTYMPPNLGANSTYLETLHVMLIHERRGRDGAPRGLDLAFSTPRSWLEDGQTISVNRAPTSFGLLSYSLARQGSDVDITVNAPSAAKAVRLRLRLPAGERIRSVRLGSRPVAFDAASGTIRVPASHSAVELTARVG